MAAENGEGVGGGGGGDHRHLHESGFFQSVESDRPGVGDSERVTSRGRPPGFPLRSPQAEENTFTCT